MYNLCRRNICVVCARKAVTLWIIFSVMSLLPSFGPGVLSFWSPLKRAKKGGRHAGLLWGLLVDTRVLLYGMQLLCALFGPFGENVTIAYLRGLSILCWT